MFEAVMAGRSQPRILSRSSRRAMRCLRRSICFRILVFTQKPPCFGDAEFVDISNTSQNAEGFRVLSCNDPSEPIRVRSFKALGTLAMTAVDKVTIKAEIRTIVAMRLFVLMFGFLCFVGLSAAAACGDARISRNEAACLRNAGRGGKT